jgi:hypothetical protein
LTRVMLGVSGSFRQPQHDVGPGPIAV